MRLSRSLRRFVAVAAAVLFMACQGIAVAAVPASAPPQAGETQAPCHDAGGDSGKRAADGCPSQCLYGNAASTPSKVVFATDELPVIVVAFEQSSDFAQLAPAAAVLPMRIKPPPLRILNCCLRN